MLIAIEGVSGSGKSTLARKVIKLCSERNIDVEWITGFQNRKSLGPVARVIADYIRDDRFIRIPWYEELPLLVAEFWESIRLFVNPAIAEKRPVLYECYIDSLIAYQAARLLEAQIPEINDLASALNMVSKVTYSIPRLKQEVIPSNKVIYVEPVSETDLGERLENRDHRPYTQGDSFLQDNVHKAYEILLSNRKNVMRVSAKDQTSQLRYCAKIVEELMGIAS